VDFVIDQFLMNLCPNFNWINTYAREKLGVSYNNLAVSIEVILLIFIRTLSKLV